VTGDVRDLKEHVDYGHTASQRIHQMVTGQVRWLLTYQAQARGMNVVLQDEKYPSQMCPVCGGRHKLQGLEYVCNADFDIIVMR
jgi:putative transposase